MINYSLIILVCALISFTLVPVMIKVAKHVNAVSIPHSRHIHTKAMPLLGGLAIFVSFLFGFMLFFSKVGYLPHNTVYYEIPAIMIAAIIILLLGIVDDINPIRARSKFFVQIIVAVIIVYFGNLRLDNVFTFLPENIDTQLSNILTIFWILSVINAINIVDGLNGLSAGVSIIYFATVILVPLFGGIENTFVTFIAAIALGSTLGYLPWNFPKAKVFMGDTGSMFLGLIISIIPLLGYQQVTVVSLFLPMMMLVIPVFEIFTTVIRRILNNTSIAEADSNHLHHQLLRATNSPVKAVLLIWFVSILFSIDSLIFVSGQDKIGYNIVAWLFFIILIVVTFVLLQLSKEFNNYESTIRKLIKKFKNR